MLTTHAICVYSQKSTDSAKYTGRDVDKLNQNVQTLFLPQFKQTKAKCTRYAYLRHSLGQLAKTRFISVHGVTTSGALFNGKLTWDL